MKLTKNLKVIISVVAALVVALVIAAVLPIMLIKQTAHAAGTEAEFKFQYVNADGNELTGEDVPDITTEYGNKIIYIKVSILNPTTHWVNAWEIHFTYDKDKLVLNNLVFDDNFSSAVYTEYADADNTAGTGYLNVVQSADVAYGDADLTIFTMQFKVKVVADDGAAGNALFTVDSQSVSTPDRKDTGLAENYVIPSTGTLNSDGIDKVVIRVPSDDASAKDVAFFLVDKDGKKIASDDSYYKPQSEDPTNTEDRVGLKYSYTESTHTYTLTDQIGYTAANYIWVEGKANDANAVVEGLGHKEGEAADVNKKAVAYDNADDLSGEINAAFKITAERNGSTPVEYKVELTRKALSEDVDGAFKFEAESETAGSPLEVTTNLKKTDLDHNYDTTDVEANQIIYKYRHAVTLTANTKETTSVASITYKKVVTEGEATVITVDPDDPEQDLEEEGDYIATIKIRSEKAQVLDNDDYSLEYTVKFAVKDGSHEIEVTSVTLQGMVGTTATTYYGQCEKAAVEGSDPIEYTYTWRFYTTTEHTTEADIDMNNKTGWTITIVKKEDPQVITYKDEAVSDCTINVTLSNTGENTDRFVVKAENQKYTHDQYFVIVVTGGLELRDDSHLYFATYSKVGAKYKLAKLGTDGKKCKDVPYGETAYLVGFNDSMINAQEKILRSKVISQFKNESKYLQVTNGEGTVLSGDGTPIGTNFKVNLLDDKNNVIQTVSIIVLGDITGDGYININDANAMLQIIARINTAPTDYEKIAADLSMNGTVDVADTNVMADHLSGDYPLWEETDLWD